MAINPNKPIAAPALVKVNPSIMPIILTIIPINMPTSTPCIVPFL